MMMGISLSHTVGIIIIYNIIIVLQEPILVPPRKAPAHEVG